MADLLRGIAYSTQWISNQPRGDEAQLRREPESCRDRHRRHAAKASRVHHRNGDRCLFLTARAAVFNLNESAYPPASGPFTNHDPSARTVSDSAWPGTWGITGHRFPARIRYHIGPIGATPRRSLPGCASYET